jgi:hypothetical protein
MGNADNEQAIQANERGSKEDRREKLPIAEQSGSRRPEETSRDQPVALRGGSCERDFHSHEAGTRGSAEPMGRRNLAAGTSPEQNEHYRYGELHFLCFRRRRLLRLSSFEI